MNHHHDHHKGENMQHRRTWLLVPIVAGLVLAACGSDDTASEPTSAGTATTVSTSDEITPDSDAAATTAAETEDTATDDTATDDTATDGSGATGGGAVDLSADCPATVVIQTDWNPESEHGWLYQMVGDGYEIDKDAVSVTGPLVAPDGSETGVDIEIRSGGPAIGFQTVTSQLYSDEDILLGYVYTDEAIQNAGEFPSVAIYAGMEKNPQIIMWDPETYPDVETIADLGQTDAVVRYFGGAAHLDYFVAEGILSAHQVDGSPDRTPANLIADQGAAAQ
ncbi:MAG: hypothetical protein ACR2HP_00715, partial [Ilumatobacteraceae bacterium]